MGGKDEELEVKFYLSQRQALEEKIIAQGGKLKAERVHELNLRYDTADQALVRQGKLLRLRQDTRARLTFKGPGSEKSGARLRQELEITVSDFETARRLLEGLGFTLQLMYEKYRTTYELDGLEVVVDEMPYGDFAEIEAETEGGAGETIQKVAERLGLDWERRNLESYTVLFEKARAALGFTFRDLSFENFKDLSIGPETLGVQISDHSD